MFTLNDELKANLKEQREREELQTGGWQLLTTTGTDKLSGRIRLRLSNKQEVLGLQKAFHGSSLQVGELTATIQISNLSCDDLPQCQGTQGAPLFHVGGAPGLLRQ